MRKELERKQISQSLDEINNLFNGIIPVVFVVKCKLARFPKEEKENNYVSTTEILRETNKNGNDFNQELGFSSAVSTILWL